MILSIDASTTGCSVALVKEGFSPVNLNSKIQHSSAENLTLMIERLMKSADLAYSDLKAIAVAQGPGSYTGLRIAVSTAKGLAYGLNLPIIAYPTLRAMAYQIKFTGGVDLICSMIDARRMEVYCGFYDADSKEEVREVEAVIIDENSFSDLLEEKKVLFIGEGSQKCKGVINHLNAFFIEDVIYPEASFSTKIVWQKWETEDFEDLELLEPFYLKEYLFKTKKKAAN